MATSITMETSYSGKESTRSITNVNPNASNADIATFATELNGLTDNTLKKVNRIDKNEIKTDITYYNVILSRKTSSESEHITFDQSTNTVTIDAASMQQNDNEFLGLQMDINVNGGTIHITNPPKIIDWTLVEPSGFAIYADGQDFGINFIKDSNVSANFTVTLAGGSFIASGTTTTYYYSPVTITVIINA